MKDEIMDCIIETLQGEGGTVEWNNLVIEYKDDMLEIVLQVNSKNYWYEYYEAEIKKNFKITLSKEQVKNQIIKRLFGGIKNV